VSITKNVSCRSLVLALPCAASVVSGLKALKPDPLATYYSAKAATVEATQEAAGRTLYRKDVTAFDPRRPAAPENFKIPASRCFPR
jgi:hypothetical protein